MNTIVFKRPKTKIFLNCLWVIAFTLIAYILAHVLVPRYEIWISLAIALFCFYYTFVIENISFEISGKTLTYLKKGIVQQEIILDSNASVKSEIVTKDYFVSTLTLYINDEIIDCTPLGYATFVKLMNEISNTLEKGENEPWKN